MGARAKGACHASEQRKRGRQRQAIYCPPAAHLCRQRICVSIPAFKHMRYASDANFTRAGPGQAGRAGAARQHLLRIEVGRQVAREDADHDKALLQAVRSAPLSARTRSKLRVPRTSAGAGTLQPLLGGPLSCSPTSARPQCCTPASQEIVTLTLRSTSSAPTARHAPGGRHLMSRPRTRAGAASARYAGAACIANPIPRPYMARPPAPHATPHRTHRPARAAPRACTASTGAGHVLCSRMPRACRPHPARRGRQGLEHPLWLKRQQSCLRLMRCRAGQHSHEAGAAQEPHQAGRAGWAPSP